MPNIKKLLDRKSKIYDAKSFRVTIVIISIQSLFTVKVMIMSR